ncbi:hypothetical protein [Azospirillum sp. TSO22-1]|uniref:hypothetical protein n=1 Tax=Azospirillum sp. TSO22-1 TaxID=716789 RepID=UPI000D609DBD|nr:hypothetical protein [Azospirillum sp. TSO22-1]PWC56963.1 hypothetical protein TSO221_00380 [Azospirillum sp. TSO22-1]
MPAVQTVSVLPAPAETRATDPGRCVTFAVRADADPGALPRVLELFAKRGLVPTALRSELLPEAGMLDISVEVVGMVRAESDHVANCLRAIPLVGHVLTAERTVA